MAEQLVLIDKKPKKAVKKPKERGCDFCPLNKVRGLKKVKNLDRIQGNKIMVWAQNPGREEDRRGLELVGPAGQLLWHEAKKVGLTRDMCDIQNVVRCWTVDVGDENVWTPRNPTKEELHCCSIYTEEALVKNSGKARVHLVLGQVAAKALLRGEYRKGQNTFWSERLNAWVVLTYHPSYFLRGGPQSRLKDFREALELAVMKAKVPRGRFRYIQKQDYARIPAAGLPELEKEIVAADTAIAVDIEDGTDEEGKNVIVYVGFSFSRGRSRGVFLYHSALRKKAETLRLKLAFLKRILENKSIKKVLHHGVYDLWKLKKLLGITLRGYVHDTEYSEYLRFSWAKAYGLEAIADRRFRLFAGYKGILEPYIKRDRLLNFYKVPLRVIVLYNGCDCDLTKRIQMSNRGKVNAALLRAMMRAAPVLARMEDNGPVFDWQHSEALEAWIPQKLEVLKEKLRTMSGNKNLNPNTPKEISKIVYKKLGLGKHLDEEWKKDHKGSTDKDTMQLLGKFHEFPNVVIQYRKLHKKKTTYMDSYKLSAKMNQGRLRTKWWLTGTITCRLRSGGSRAKESGIVNLQNVHGDPVIENLLVSDLSWRELYDDWKVARQ
jgi:uracil-DNA glycosylase family 4